MSVSMTNFIQRTITGILFTIIVIGAIIIHPISYGAIFLAVIIIGIREFKRMIDDNQSKIHYSSALTISLFIYLFSFALHYWHLHIKWITLLVPLTWLPFMIELFQKNPKPFRNIGLTFLSIIYITIPITLLHLMAFKDGEYGFIPVLCFFVLVWINDSGAYLVGVNFGKHKLYERISPKKTIEGFVGGIVCNLIAAYFIFQYTQIGSLWIWMATALVISVIGTAGDLIESMLKRSLNVKDSGTFLPGHGGILDRFDAALFSAPMVSLLFYYFT